MTTVTIDNRSYPCPSAWNEIGWETVFYAGGICRADGRHFCNGTEKRSGYWSAFAEWIREPFGRSTAGKRKTVRRLPGRTFFGFPPPFPENPDGNDSTDGFDWNGIRMLFPAPAVDPDGSVVPLAHTTAVELCEATDLYLCDKWRYAPLVVAILCRPEGEPYWEQTWASGRSMKNCRWTSFCAFTTCSGKHRYLKRNYPLCYETPDERGKDRTRRDRPGMSCCCGRDISGSTRSSRYAE